MLNYGVVGCGAVFQVFQVDSLLKTPGLKLWAICDLDEGRVKSLQERYKIPRAYTDYRKLLEDEEVQIIMVNLPQHLHREVSVEAARAGKHVYVEKPIATTLSDARAIIQACKEAKVKLCVGHQRRFINVEMKAKELIDEGYLGEVFKVRATASWFEPQENLLSKDWWYRKECGGGPLMRWGVHKTDTLRYLLTDDAIRVYAEMGRFVHKNPPVTVEDTLVALFRFQKGAIVELEVSNAQREGGSEKGLRGETVEIWGTEGTLWYRPSTGEMELLSTKRGGEFEKIVVEPDGMEMVRIHQEFIKSIEENTSSPVSGEDGYKALEMVVTSYRSAEERRVIEL